PWAITGLALWLIIISVDCDGGAAMSEFVKKTMMGYKEVSGGASAPDCTHVILTAKEYAQLIQMRAQAEQKSRDIKSQAEKAIKTVQSDALSRIRSSENAARQREAVMEQALSDERNARIYQQELNENLLRISRERANADRNLRPKKKHSGYVVISSTEKMHRYKNVNRIWAVATLWETALQTPYSVDFTENQARTQLKDDLFQDDSLAFSILDKIGITAVYGKEYAEMIADKQWREGHSRFNVMLDWRLRANHRAGYWEILFLHTKPLAIVPPDMRARCSG
ncbi:MAG: hypothetical protein K2N43_09360, partial [Lachnospiraceae bacterium]|nr:hypothetical protein [Lachnospiraceae bacterium]